MNKKAQLDVLYSKPILFTIGGAILGYLIAGNIGKDPVIGIIIGGIVGLIISTKV